MGVTTMEFTKYIAPDGSEYNFDTSDRFMLSEEGLGMPPISYISNRGPYQHGETPYDFRLNPRVIQMVMRQNGCSRMEYWNKRCELLNAIRPNKFTLQNFEPGRLRKTLEDGSLRDIDVLIESGPIFAPRNLDQWDEWGFTETLRFIAHNPVFYDPIPYIGTWTTGGGGGSVALYDELVFKQITSDSFRSLDFSPPYYLIFGLEMSEVQLPTSGFTGGSGGTRYTCQPTWHSFPTITITGPIEHPVIVNNTINEKIELIYNIADGEVVTVDLSYGHKNISNSDGVNLFGTLSTDSDFATFRIACDPEAPNGVNSITVTGSGVTSATVVTVSYYASYIGI